MNARADILARVRRAAGRNVSDAEVATAKPQPAAVAVDDAVLVQQFSTLAAATQMSVALVANSAEIPLAVRRYLDERGLEREVVVDTQLPVAAEHWHAAGVIGRHGDTAPDGDVYVRAGYAAVAECGAVVIASGAGRALRNDFLAKTHIVVVPRSRLLPRFDDLWTLLRAQQAAGLIAREICLVTGPSRTADLGVPAKLGAHGPARVHVLIDLGSGTHCPPPAPI